LVPVLVFWAVGAIAVARGLTSWGFSDVLHDVGLIEYSVLIPLIVVLVCDRASFIWLCRAVAIAGLLGIVFLAVTQWTPPEWDLAYRFDLIAAASGMYAAIYVAWVLARRAAGLTVAPWQYATVVAASGLIIVGSARSAWLGLMVVFACIAALGLPARRLRLAAQLAAILVLGTAVATGAQEARTVEIPSPSTAAAQLVRVAPAGHAKPAAVTREGPATPSAHPSEPTASAGSEAAAVGTSAAERSGAGPARRQTAHGGPPSLYLNPGIESGTLRGYVRFAPDGLIASTGRTLSGDYALRATYAGDPRLAKTVTYLPLDPATKYRVSAAVYIPSSWSGGEVNIGTDGTWAHAAEHTGRDATTTRDAWTRIQMTFRPDQRDLIGGIHVRGTGAPAPGDRIYIDDVTLEPVGGPARSETPALATAPASPQGKASDRGEPAAGGETAPDANATGLGELAASFRPSSEQANASWRLAFWKFVLAESAKRPLWGVGFGTPANFEWSGIHYDSRTGDPTDPFDVSGPHNSFLNVLYRTGLPGFLALCALVLIGIARILPVARHASGTDKAIAVWLLASIASTVAFASLNVALEGPFMGIFFWTILGLALVAPWYLEGAGDRRAAR
jgi:hypothetical protein